MRRFFEKAGWESSLLAALFSVVILLLAAGSSAEEAPRTADLPFVAWGPVLGLPDAPHDAGDASAADSDTSARARFELGRELFFDPVLSADRTVSCSSCHDPQYGYADTRAQSAGIDDQPSRRNAPTLLNRAYGETFTWDGRFATLEEQVLDPIAHPEEMGLAVEDAVARLAAVPEYRERFEGAFGEAPSRQGVADALAAFVRRLRIGDSPIDRFRAADGVLTRRQRTGLWIFESKGRCWICHSGPNFTDEQFHNTGVGAADGVAEPARVAVTGADADRGRFKTPTLRGLSMTAPYMHDGSLDTLADVVEFYRRGGEPNGHLDPAMQPLELTDDEADSLVAFLEALSESEANPANSPGSDSGREPSDADETSGARSPADRGH